MRITKKCEHCGKDYSNPPSIAKRSRFCSRDCASLHGRVAERRTLKCEYCDTTFIARADHGNWPRFCSRECFCAKTPKPEWRTCPSCESEFLAERGTHSEDGLRIYCSTKCAKVGLMRGTTKKCISCGQDFYIKNATARQRKENHCCSFECRQEFYRRERSNAWKGGEYLNTGTGEKFVIVPTDDGRASYIGEHRMVAAKILGRTLTRQDVVIRINRNPSDNSPANLYVCASNSEFSKRRCGSLPWPTKSNLPLDKAHCLEDLGHSDESSIV